jgi:hypothetical protein
VTDAHREQLNGPGVVETVWERFEENVAERWGTAGPYINREVEDALREFFDVDEFASLEERVRRVAEATGRSRRRGKEKSLLTRSAGAPRTRVFPSVHPDLKAELEAFARENDVPKWKVLTAALCEYNDGGRAQRLRDLLSPDVVDDVDEAFAELADGEGKASTVERRTRNIAKRLGESFDRTNLVEEIEAEGLKSDPTIDKYVDRVTKYKGVKQWGREDDPDVFFPPEVFRTAQTSEIIRNLGGEPDTGTPPPAFSKRELVAATRTAGVEVVEENREEVNEYKKRVLDRTGHKWDEESERFVLAGSNPADTVGTSDVDDDEQPEDLEDEAEKKMARLDAATRERAMTDGGDPT